MRPYLDLLRHVLEHGERRTDRTGTGTISLFGAQTRYDLREGFPLVTTKKLLFPAVVRELLWFLRGSTNIHDDLTQHTPIWDAWATAEGDLGPIYGHQWRHWGVPPGEPGGVDQISQALQAGNLSAAQQAYTTLQQDLEKFARGNGPSTQGGSAQPAANVSVQA